MRDVAQERFEALFGPEFGHGKPFDLARLRAVLHALGDPQEKLPPVIHVAGTNGKGSTIAFLRAFANLAGLLTHTFVKPHLFTLGERFKVTEAGVQREAADDEALIAAAEEIARIDSSLTNFDAQVAAAFLLFSRLPADLVLLETGMGGRDDSTNVIVHPAATVITPVGLDHQDALGATLADIAAHKAGILKPSVPAIVARQAPEAMSVIEAAAARVGAPLFRQGVEWDAFAQNGRLVVQTEDRLLDLSPPALKGAHQVDNAGLAVATCLLGLRNPAITEAAINRGLGAVGPELGRLSLLHDGPSVDRIRKTGGRVWLDGGHNAHAAAALARWLKQSPEASLAPKIVIIGMRARKDADAFLAEFVGAADKILTVPLSDTHIPPADLAARARKLGLDASAAPSFEAAMKQASRFDAPLVLVCGSFLLVAEALRAAHGDR